MTAAATYITTTIPYVNARPHIGFALELVQADVLARYRRAAGDRVRFQAGTDDNSLKNVLAAEAAGAGVQQFVDRNAAAFTALAAPLSLSVDDTIRTSSDPRHRAGVERLWQACAEAGDLYRQRYEGLYCVGCEQFCTPAELTDDGRCPDHGTRPERVEEENWFFRLSRYASRLRAAVESGAPRIEPAQRRNEVLAFIDGGLTDFSVSRSRKRARGWGIPVPGDPDQVIYVWFDALGNYLSALGYGGPSDTELARWWRHADRRIHLLGKGVLRFHAVYWPAILLSAGEPLPTDIVVHDYLTADGRKISKSGGSTTDPAGLAARYGTDALRWWLLREVPRTGDTDFTLERLVNRANDELANGIGNLVNRVITLIAHRPGGSLPDPGGSPPDPEGSLPGPGGSPPHPWRDSRRAPTPDGGALRAAIGDADRAIGDALADYDYRRATEAVWRIAVEANRYIERARPWELARDSSPETGAVLGTLLSAGQALGEKLGPFLPDAAQRITRQCAAGPDGRLPAPEPVLPRIGSPGLR